MSIISNSSSKVAAKARKRAARTGNDHNFIDETGQRFGRLLVIKADGRYNGEATWQCQCDCGAIINNVRGFLLRRKSTTSCGCFQKEKLRKINHDRINPNRDQYQKLARAKRQEGMSYRAIACWFAENNIPSLKGGQWYGSTIKWLIELETDNKE